MEIFTVVSSYQPRYLGIWTLMRSRDLNASLKAIKKLLKEFKKCQNSKQKLQKMIFYSRMRLQNWKPLATKMSLRSKFPVKLLAQFLICKSFRIKALAKINVKCKCIANKHSGLAIESWMVQFTLNWTAVKINASHSMDIYIQN